MPAFLISGVVKKSKLITTYLFFLEGGGSFLLYFLQKISTSSKLFENTHISYISYMHGIIPEFPSN